MVFVLSHRTHTHTHKQPPHTENCVELFICFMHTKMQLVADGACTRDVICIVGAFDDAWNVSWAELSAYITCNTRMHRKFPLRTHTLTPKPAPKQSRRDVQLKCSYFICYVGGGRGVWCGLNYARFNCILHSELCTRSQEITPISARYAVTITNYIYKIIICEIFPVAIKSNGRLCECVGDTSLLTSHSPPFATCQYVQIPVKHKIEIT